MHSREAISLFTYVSRSSASSADRGSRRRPKEPDYPAKATVTGQLAEVDSLQYDVAIAVMDGPGESQESVMLIDIAGYHELMGGHLSVEATDVLDECLASLDQRGWVAVRSVIRPCCLEGAAPR
jgi:hypothetical protein